MIHRARQRTGESDVKQKKRIPLFTIGNKRPAGTMASPADSNAAVEGSKVGESAPILLLSRHVRVEPPCAASFSRRASVSRIRIGISGWQYGDWQGPFYPPDLPQKDRLRYLARRFEARARLLVGARSLLARGRAALPRRDLLIEKHSPFRVHHAHPIRDSAASEISLTRHVWDEYGKQMPRQGQRIGCLTFAIESH